VSDAEFEVGVTEPGVALTGGLVDLDILAEPAVGIVPSEEVAFATTRKAIKYFMSPVGGTVTVANVASTAADSGATPDSGATAATVNEAPYDVWLFRMTLAAGADATLVDGVTYAAKLAASEHATAAAAAGAAAAKAGKISPTCKSIYSGIKL
jgi:glycine cleavage system H lipoate-binding protein